MTRTIPDSPPDLDELPDERSRTRVGGPETRTFDLTLETVTPILGGAPETRTVDEIDVVRVPTIRGHLRFWWRALHAHQYEDSDELYEAESRLWGHATQKPDDHDDENWPAQARSPVEVEVDVDRSTCDIDRSDPDFSDDDFYALWPAQGQSDGTPPAPRYEPGIEFELDVRVPDALEAAPDRDPVEEVERTVRAWLLFGGYGGRTRRGLGSLTVVGEDADRWLPDDTDAEALRELLGDDVFAPTDVSRETPLLAGAELRGRKGQQPLDDAESAWTRALKWLRDFRQGEASRPRNDRYHAREHCDDHPNKPGRSNWPEGDKARKLEDNGPYDHSPKHGDDPVWPRAAFGLPIEVEFKDANEPRDFHLTWYGPSEEDEGAYDGGRRGYDEYDRLASPLVLTPMPLADGTFKPVALWFKRSFPEEGKVGLSKEHGWRDWEGTLTDFDTLVGEGDDPQFSPLEGADSLREAFFDWLRRNEQVRELV